MTGVQIIDSVLSAVAKDETGCWLWTGVRNNHGYGKLYVRPRMESAHRVSYAAFVGPIPEGFEIDHLCRVRACVNPEHLEAVTGAENRRRQAAAVTHCPRGHAYTPDNTGFGATGGRVCRQCTRERQRAAYRKRNPVLRSERPRGDCHRGHPPTPENTYVTPSTGQVHCLACRRERARARRARSAP